MTFFNQRLKENGCTVFRAGYQLYEIKSDLSPQYKRKRFDNVIMYTFSVITTSPEFFLRHQNQPVSQIYRCPKVYSVLAKIKMTLRRKLRWADG